MRKRTGLTRDEHFELGKRLQAAHDICLKASVQICNSYKAKGKEVSAVNAAYRAVRNLKCVMDNTICQETDPSDREALRAYYPGSDSESKS